MTTKPIHDSRFGGRLALCMLALAVAACDSDPADDGPGEDGGAVLPLVDAGAPSAPGGCGDEDAGGTCEDGHSCIDGRCVPNTCGDGVRGGGEACDDSNVAPGDGCDPACRVELESCGDAIVQRPEECDDGNVYELDTCSNACTRVECTNGRLDGNEECDDGDLNDTNGCSNACTENRCRNGRVDPGEECDDGNRTHDDACSNGCKVVECGNGRVDPGEECDDENLVDDDACSDACVASSCGNNRLDLGEVCDGDTTEIACASDCKSTIAIEDSPCRMCEESKCKANLGFEGFDVLNGCISLEAEGHAAREAYGASLMPDEGTFVQHCTDVVDCAHSSACWNDARGPFVACYCGSRSEAECLSQGPADDAPCRAEWEEATGGTTAAEVFGQSGDSYYAAGWAFELLACDARECRQACVD